MSDSSHNQAVHEHAAHGEVSNDTINTEPWLERWWALLVIGYGAMLALVLGYMAYETFGR